MKTGNGKRLEAVFYKLPSGNEPVRDEIKKLSKEEMKIVGEDVMAVEMGWPIGLPVCRPLKNGLWEVRSELNNRIFRIIFAISVSKMVLLHAFIKKTRATPSKELELAQKRLADHSPQKGK